MRENGAIWTDTTGYGERGGVSTRIPTNRTHPIATAGDFLENHAEQSLLLGDLPHS